MIAPLALAKDPAARSCPFSGALLPEPEAPPSLPTPPDPAQRLSEALQYLELMQREGVLTQEAVRERLAKIRTEMHARDSYWQTSEEVEHGAKVAWRNSARCIGRLYWQKLVVRDLRHLDSAEAIFEALVEHLRLATNDGKIIPTISVFAPPEPGSPGIRIWNPQLVRYAGYRRPDGTVLGDPVSVAFTEVVTELGWRGGAGTAFDLLPLVIQMPGEEPKMFDLPADAVLEVPIRHPSYPAMEELGLKWHAVPIISNMRMEIGGVSYTAAPFNGWYMGTEIGARNFGDEARYDLLPEVAKLMGLETRSNRTLWRDRALVELDVAVLHSFHEQGVTIIDHHTASKHFLRHEEFERQAERPVPADWAWLVPPVAGSTSPLFHREYFDTPLKPNYFYQPNPWAESLPYAAQQAAQDDPARAERDGLTGLLHRGALDCRLPRFGRDGGAIALVDLDGLAAINEEHGEVVGNALLRSTARAVLGVVRPDDECARSGGDEFCVLLRGVESAPDAIMVVERIRRALEAVRVEGAAAARPSVCVGLALVTPGDDPSEGLRRASEALAAAKAQAPGSVVIADEEAVTRPVPPRHPPVERAQEPAHDAAADSGPAAKCPWSRFLGLIGRGG